MIDAGSSSNSNFNPRLSFSTELRINSTSLSPNPRDDDEKEYITQPDQRTLSTEEFEFLSGGLTNMIAADELFSEGKLLPFWQMQRSDQYKHSNRMNSLKPEENLQKGFEKSKNVEKKAAASWFLDDDPSPRPPTCTVIWKELLRLRKQRASSLSPSSSSSSSSSRSSKNETSSADHGAKELGENKERLVVKKIQKVVERTRSVRCIRIRPVVTVAVGSQRKNNVSPLFYSRKGNLER
ncbi:hypothetical protein F511_17678 [Dorcoceras hygrometricum]|uniref:Uncharacterized protein n=1 Tax=Dorcoceras hygrometricum TaxID=472368 RepID=A0A2Z7B6X7_9LAMI|nr:hypothetical protein F511_17678 [Dorcoceras hygrometricum]